MSEQLSVSDLISISQAVVEYRLPLSRLRSWRRCSHLVPVGKLRADAPNGGVLMFRRTDIERLIVDPPLRGRPGGPR